MPLDPAARAYLDAVAAVGAPPITELEPAEARRTMEATAADLFGPTDPVGAVDRPGDPGARSGCASTGPPATHGIFPCSSTSTAAAG